MKLQYQHCRSIHLENLIKVFKVFYDYFFFQLYLQNNEKKVDFEYYKDLCTDYFRSNDPSALGNFITGKLVFSDTWFLWFWNRNPDEMYSKNTDLVVYRRKMILMTSYWHVFDMDLTHDVNLFHVLESTWTCFVLCGMGRLILAGTYIVYTSLILDKSCFLVEKKPSCWNATVFPL